MVNNLFSIRKQIVYGASAKGKQIHCRADRYHPGISGAANIVSLGGF